MDYEQEHSTHEFGAVVRTAFMNGSSQLVVSMSEEEEGGVSTSTYEGRGGGVRTTLHLYL